MEHALPLRALVILVVSLATTLAGWWAVAEQGHRLARARFEAVAAEAIEELRYRMDAHAHLLRSGVALLESSDGVTRREWRTFVERLEVAERFPAIQGLGFAVHVPPEAMARHEAEVRAEGYPAYRVTPPGPRPDYFPILYLEPFEGRNLRAFGFDMFAEPQRRAAMEQARDTGDATLTGRVRLVQETDDDVQAGTLLYLALYDGPATDVEARRRRILGFVYSPFRMNDMMRAIFAARLENLCIAIFDTTGGGRDPLFANKECQAGDFHLAQPLDLYGRKWLVSIHSTPALDATTREGYPWLVLAAGVIISFLLMAAVASMLAERRRRVLLAQANRDLQEARARAEAANASKSRFLAAASHDLRQPLQTLGIYLHLLAAKVPHDGAPLVRAAGQAFDAAKRMLDSLFDLAALESGKIRPEPRRVDVAEILSRIATDMRAEAQAKGLALRSRSCRTEIETDPVMLERVLRNLLSNALKYTQRGAVMLACHTVPGGVRIKVADSGPGIPPEARDLIFEDFYQLGNPERDPRRGLGLGLATVARLSRLLGYRLEVYSRLGKGSTFVVEIPRKNLAKITEPHP